MTRSKTSSTRARLTALVLAVSSIGVVAQIAEAPTAQAAAAPQLTRYPYLTDVVQTFATINWGTDRSAIKGSVKYGVSGQESCTAHTVSASKTSITVKNATEYQWKAKLSGLQPNTQYCYRIFLGSTDLLGQGTPSPTFWSQIPAGANTPYSFAVFGDWGDTDANGNNPQQKAIMTSIANSGVRFALGTGDTGYDSGTQANYGDLQQTGYRVSSIFGPDGWSNAGATVPFFNAVGNHGMNATFFNNWPQDRAVSTSSGKYKMETYCCANGANSQTSPSAWYAFDVGNARFYMLTTAWGDKNVGNSNDYGMDYAYRWQQNDPEYLWLKHDLQTHPSQLKFAVFHYPLFVDNATEPSNTFLQGANSLQGLLETNGVNMVFNGHAHLYERNAETAGGLQTYVTGGGGAMPEPISHCKPYDLYGIGWSQTTGGSKCGAAVKPTQVEQVFHYLKVSVNGQQVTVSGVNALGQTFDTHAYDFTPDNTPPTAPGNLQATAPAGNRVDLTWDASTDANGIQAYDIYRNGNLLTSVDGSSLTYTDNSVVGSTQYSYVVVARDPSTNPSDASNTAVVTTPALDNVDPSAPTNLQAVAPSSGRVDLTWTAASDNVEVVGYDVYRGGAFLTSVGGSTLTYSDLSVTAGTAYSYTVRARDAATNTSVDSNVAQVTTPSAGVVFQDDFESGSLSMWSTVAGLAVSQGVTAPSGGQWVARETANGGGSTYAFKSISPTVADVYARFRFEVLSRTGSVDLMRLRNNSAGSKLSLLVDGATGKLSTRNAVSGTAIKSNAVINTGQWYTVEVHGKIGSPSTTEVWLDGTLLPELSATGDLGTTNFGQFLLGQTGVTGTYDVAFDDAIVSKNPI